MDPAELSQQLARKNYRVVDLAANQAGDRVLYIEVAPDCRVAMFHPDAVDLVVGRATIQEIATRNKDADLAEPWPVA